MTQRDGTREMLLFVVVLLLNVAAFVNGFFIGRASALKQVIEERLEVNR